MKLLLTKMNGIQEKHWSWKKFKAINVYFYKEQRSQIMNLTFHPNSLKKEEQTQPKSRLKKKVIKTRR